MPSRSVDDYGNELIIDSKGSVRLCIVGKPDINIGYIVRSDNGATYTTRRKSDHIFRKNDSWGINAAVLELLKEGDIIVIECYDQGMAYTIEASNAKVLGAYLLPMQEGYERNVFIPRDKFVREKLHRGIR